ncbi:hypothetical protein [Coxiella burnetii]|uniref:Uncharacterized protein n=1 Tax=Coxiella burnetii (strain RSA 493 / Nine Mile phase I) TaxID=227377 RepID=B5QS65_COXBU|nr:hypothetical protein [Coxiella burnetii]YP_002332937.1 hypothetical protein CBU_2095a [Coxiella burnetii RSA 493]ACI15228.1 hypothetical protein CBU_2095a [Coxiella burnetii RSA 493]ACJ17460.1 hypothetical protein CbuG_0001 [Coxiella burnetii CbuG_Q212]AML48118.1 hypothetical protein AUR58_02195 [Coxiella burnetii]AML54138.1 hypothetical protein AYM38_01845 [Coxiella burnetii]ARI64929.1 hypothetical protein B7L74_00005 [Coxiella burnetii]
MEFVRHLFYLAVDNLSRVERKEIKVLIVHIFIELALE